jgi:uncharacterized damage-inducible protein DinB
MSGNPNTDLLLYMLEDVRRVTLKGISGLSKEQLFREPLPGEYCIGAYLMHLAEVDLGWLKVMDGKEIDAELRRKSYYDSWFDAGDKELEIPKEPLETEEYLDTLAKCRERLTGYIKTLTDAELDKKFTVTRKRMGQEKTKEYTRKWIIYHLIEHEAHTRGQMFLLIRKAEFKKKGENN